MKNLNFPLAVAAFASAVAAPVLAQSSVVMYGIADAGIMKTSGEPTKFVSGVADGSRLGFKGTEDIGGGWKAIFNLEARVEIDTGGQSAGVVTPNQGLYLTRGMTAFEAPQLAPVLASIRAGLQPAVAVNPDRALFDRTAMVGLVTPLGAILIGRMYTPGYEVFAAADAFEAGTGGSWGHILGGAAGFTAAGADIRSPKSIQYRIATPSGLGGSLMYGGRNSGYLSRYSKFLGAALTYKANGFDVGVAHNRGEDQNGNRSLVTSTVGGSVVLGGFKVFAGYHDQVNRNSVLMADYVAVFNGQVVPALRGAGLPPAAVAGLSNVFLTNIARNSQIDAASYQFGMHYRIGAGRVMASVARQNDRSASDSDATLFALGYDYNLSKRTDVYAVVANIQNQNDGQYTPGTANAPGGFTRTPGETSRAVQLGVRHRF